MSKKNILHVTPRSRGGIREHLLLLLRQLKGKRDCVISVLSPEDEYLEARLDDLGVTHHSYKERRGGAFTSLSLFFSLSRIIFRDRIEILHSHGYKAGLACGVAGTLFFRKHISVIHTNLHRDGDGILKRLVKYMAQLMLSMMSRHVVFVSDDVADKFPANVSREKFHVIHTGADFEKFALMAAEPETRRNLGVAENATLIGCVARLSPEKGVHALIDAMPDILAAFPGATLLVVGDGPQREELRLQAAQLGVSGRCVFTGFREDISRIMPLFDIFVMPSLSEAFGLALMEALFHEKIVVATSAGGIPEIILDGETGRLVEPGDSSALAETIIDTLSHIDIYAELGATGKAYVTKIFTLENMTRKTMRLYER